MRSKTYLKAYKSAEVVDAWHQVKPGTGAVVAQTTPLDELYIAGEIHDISVLDPAEIISRFEAYENVNDSEGNSWIL
jgi:hypothetical protein